MWQGKHLFVFLIISGVVILAHLMSWYARYQNFRPLEFWASLVVSECILCHVGSCLGQQIRGLALRLVLTIVVATATSFDHWFSSTSVDPNVVPSEEMSSDGRLRSTVYVRVRARILVWMSISIVPFLV